MSLLGSFFFLLMVAAALRRVWSWAIPAALGVALSLLAIVSYLHGYAPPGRAGK